MKYLLGVALLLQGCSTVSQIPDTSKVYRHDLAVTINKIPCAGVCVVKQAPSYQFHVEASRIDYVSFETCHRKISLEDQGDSWDYTYIPQSLESDCPVSIITLDKKASKNGYALIVFDSEVYKYPSKLMCDGKSIQSTGSSICQSKLGLVQAIQFEDTMKVHPDPKCPLNGDNDGKLFTYRLNRGACVYVFMSPKGEFHKMYSIGTDDLILKEL